ncbi:Alt-like RNA polymerase ADP-ribosyltransferase [Escherichia phage EcS1]|uniref:NAD(+)--arginine ADP-ribosyltransferase n=1 Tax=Escherichia phage EcS1 TaxID=2083276 RepID=A0A2Z5ZD96_9CAUD|nr:Alt-like RNA polymerase ADP-ribosyltransferase [Escherichia phage EcS1]BBC78263.1 RNA polymerase ADP-ribosylase [Escherichia phage EcS1]
MTDNLLVEVFDSESENGYPVIDLNPKAKVPQLWSIKVPGNDKLVARMVSYLSQGDATKQIKQGDKYAHVILMSLSDKGTPAELKGGLGSDPVGALNTIFDTVYSVVKKNRMDAVMFRFPAKKMKGQERTVQRIMQRLVMARTGGQFKVLDALYTFTSKHAYILIYRKSRGLEDISGIPEINSELYTKVESKVGDVYVSKKTGENVTKDEAFAGSIAEIEKDRSDRSVINRTKVSRRQVAASQSMATDSFSDPKWDEIEARASKFNKPATANLVPEARELELVLTSKAARTRSAERAVNGIGYRLKNLRFIDEDTIARMSDRMTEVLIKNIGQAPLTSVKSMQEYAKLCMDMTEDFKEDFIDKQLDDNYGMSKERAQAEWTMLRTKFIKESLQNYAKNVSDNINGIAGSRTPLQYPVKEQRGIREYVGSGYHDINDYLLGRWSEQSSNIMNRYEVLEAIDGIDAAFERGDRIPENITLWRSQTIRKPIWESLIKNRVFYFRNYVSTSLAPIIFGGWKGNSAIGLAPEEVRSELNIDAGSEEAKDMPGQFENDIRVTVGWAIDGGHKINVIFPGDLSNMPSEMEIILPRGTMVSINSITDASYNDGIQYSNQKFIQAEIMTSEQIEESTIVYDGDALFENGELVAMDTSEPLNFTSFVKASKPNPNKEGLALLASLIDIQEIPERFIQG